MRKLLPAEPPRWYGLKKEDPKHVDKECGKNSTPKSLKPLHSNTSRDRTRESAFEGIFQLARSHIRTDSFSILEAHRPKLDGFRNRDQ